MNTLEKKEYYEVNLPPYLQHDLDAMKEGKYPYDCLWCELYGSLTLPTAKAGGFLFLPPLH